MASFDFIESSSNSYKFIWKERTTLGRFIIFPVLLKILTLFMILGFSLEENYLRQGLLFLPSYFAEGFLVMQVLRLALLKENLYGWRPLPPSQHMNESHRLILAGTIIYTLVKLGMAFFAGMTMNGAVMEMNAQTEPSPEQAFQVMMGGFFMLGFLVWGFRFLWLYIPMTLNYDLRDFIKKTKGIDTAFYMMGAWILCFAPIAMLLILSSEILNNILPPTDEGISSAYKYAISALQALGEILAALISSLAVAYGIRSIMGDKNKPARPF